MNNLENRSAVLLLSTLYLLTGAYGQITPHQDSYIDVGTPAGTFSSIVQAGNSRFDPTASRTVRTDRPPVGPASGGNGLTIIVYVAAVELALAAIAAGACGLVLAIAGICVSFEDRRRRAKFLRWKAPRKTSARQCGSAAD